MRSAATATTFPSLLITPTHTVIGETPFFLRHYSEPVSSQPTGYLLYLTTTFTSFPGTSTTFTTAFPSMCFTTFGSVSACS